MEFATTHDLVVINSMFKKRKTHLITFQSGGHDTQIDCFLMRKCDLRACTDCKVLLDEGCSSQHKLLVMNIFVRRCAQASKRIVKSRILWKNLTGVMVETFRTRVTKRVTIKVEDITHDNVD